MYESPNIFISGIRLCDGLGLNEPLYNPVHNSSFSVFGPTVVMQCVCALPIEISYPACNWLSLNVFANRSVAFLIGFLFSAFSSRYACMGASADLRRLR